MELSYPGSLYKNNASDFGRGGKVTDSIGHIHSAHWHVPEPSNKDFSFDYKATQNEYPSASTRSRPSFLDSLGVSRGPSKAYVPYGEPEKAYTPGPFDISKIQSTEVSLSSSAQQFPDFTTADHSLKSIVPGFKNDKVLSMNSIVSSNDGKLPEPTGDHRGQRDHEFTSEKDESFSALEQVNVFYGVHLSSLHVYGNPVFLKLRHKFLAISILFTH